MKSICKPDIVVCDRRQGKEFLKKKWHAQPESNVLWREFYKKQPERRSWESWALQSPAKRLAMQVREPAIARKAHALWEAVGTAIWVLDDQMFQRKDGQVVHGRYVCSVSKAVKTLERSIKRWGRKNPKMDNKLAERTPLNLLLTGPQRPPVGRGNGEP